MSGVRIQVTGHEEALQAFAAAVRAIADPIDLFHEIGQEMVNSTRRRFEDGIAPDGSPWPPSWRARNGLGRTLVDKGMSAGLMGSITYEADAGGVRWGSNLVYAAIHQLGGVIQAKTAKGLRFRLGDRWITKSSVAIPPRPFIGLSDDDAEEVEALSGEYLAEALGGAADAG